MTAALAVLAVAGIVLLGGWIGGIDWLVRLRADYAAMVPSTALCFVLVSGMLAFRLRRADGVARYVPEQAVAGAVFAIAATDIVVLATGIAPGIDGMFWPDTDAFRTDAMAFATAFDFLLAAICLLTLGRPADRARLGYRVAATTGLLSAATAVVGYAFDAEALYGVFAFTAMALHTAVAFVVLFSAFLLAQPQNGWVGLLAGQGRGSSGARRLFPVVVLGNFLLCLFALFATDAGLFGANFRLSLLAIAMMTFSTLALLRNARIDNAAERRLLETLAELEATARDKDLLLREVNHRVKNNLQQINALISMERRRNDDPQARASFRALSERVHALGLVHQKLLGGSRSSDVAVADFLGALAGDMSAGYGLEERGIRLDVEATREPMHLEVAISIGLLVNELVVNAIKHAFPGGRGGTIRVGFGRDANGEYVLDVSDDGIGMEANVEPGVGSRIVENLVRQLRSERTTESGEGTRHRIIIPAGINEEGRYA